MVTPEAPLATVRRAAAKGAGQQVGARPVANRAPPLHVAAPRRVLLIEDDFMLRQHMAELLAAEGYNVSSAADGADALWLLEREALPGAIILDIVLPRMNGITFREVQLQSPILRDIPTIVVSATSKQLDLDSLGFTAIIAKPAPFEKLAEALAKLWPTS
ncbi:MAG: response regulator [Verrucomicrobiota bacterium]